MQPLLNLFFCIVTDDELHVEWGSPRVEMVVDYLAYMQHWEPSYTRQRLLPMLSTIYLRDMASSPTNDNLLCGQYEFHNIQRGKVRYGHEFYVVNWKKDVTVFGDAVCTIPVESSTQQDCTELDESFDLIEDTDVPYIHVDHGCCLLSTDEDMELVQKAFPVETSQFLKEKVRTLSLSFSHTHAYTLTLTRTETYTLSYICRLLKGILF